MSELDTVQRAQRILSRHTTAHVLPVKSAAHKDQVWAIFRNGDRRTRPLLRVTDSDIRTLEVSGAICGMPNAEGYVSSRFKGEGERARKQVPAPVLCVGPARKKRSGIKALPSHHIQTAHRFAADYERAITHQVSGIDWRQIERGRVDVTRVHLDTDVRWEQTKARQRLEQIRDIVGEVVFVILVAACCDGLSLRALERKFDWSKGKALKRLESALDQAAHAYEKAVSRDKAYQD